MISLVLLAVCSSAGGSPDYWVQGGSPQDVAADGAKIGESDGRLFMVPVSFLEDHPRERKLLPPTLFKMKVTVHKTMFPRLKDLFSDRPEPIPVFVQRNVAYPVVREVPVPLKEYVEVPKPYHVPVLVEKKVPVFVERKVPVKVEVPVEKPYPVEVPVPYEVTLMKKVPFIVQKKVPYHVSVPEYVEVPMPIYENGLERNLAETLGLKNDTVAS